MECCCREQPRGHSSQGVIVRAGLWGSDRALNDKGGVKASREEPLHIEEVPETGEVCGRRSRQGTDLVSILDHSIHEFESNTLRSIQGL